ncbi:hypothetical protein [Pelovirga terrestris]|uniref:Uncharacterized protein n=1 Tax=Pelovirga terrestris TaxID=2771352 RepID=A0A8J6QWA0_9BACT|nr:hypothetical protein [Pelovirga terrestris]MBD1399483.1 hypothetical protein [Pelovirga terrestris]
MNEGHQQRDMLQRISKCAEALRQHADRLPGPEPESTATLMEYLQQLALYADAVNLSSVQKIADQVCYSLARPGGLPSRLQQLESRNYSLAAEWLEQLARLYRGGLPEPRELIADLLYSFSLLEQAVGAQRVEQGGPSDLFDEDPVATSEAWNSYVQDNDPFVDDPGFGHLFDLLQRTLSHATELRADFPADPFFQDPQATGTGSVDMLAADPGRGDDGDQNNQD